MKHIMMMIICLVTLGLSSVAFATNANCVATGEIDLDGAGGMDNISVSQAGIVIYSSAVTAGGYGGAAVGDQYAVNTASTNGTDGIALEFFMRGSSGAEDNNLYQRFLGTLPTGTGGLSGCALDPSSTAGWSIRGI